MTSLSPRQMELARLLADDLTDQEISNLMQISVRTVQSHMEHIAARLGLNDGKRSRRRQIARWIQNYESANPPSASAA